MNSLHNQATALSPYPWYSLRTRSNCEKVAAIVLESKGYQQFLPVYRSRRRWSDRVVETQTPLFPGYLFCRFDPKRSLPIMTTPGVICIVGFGREPAPISDREIEAIHTIIDSGVTAEPCPFVRVGQRVRVNSGPLAGLEGILVQKKSEWRLVVSIEMLQRSVAVEIECDSISAN
jgi:transcription antitermination factor NusG